MSDGNDATRWVLVRGSERTPVDNAARVGAARANAKLTVTLVVRRRTPLEGLAPPPLGPARTLKQRIALRRRFAATHGASQKDLDAVTRFARAAGLTVVETSPARRVVRARGTVRQMNAAFNVDLGDYRAAYWYRGREGGIFVPRELEGVVEAVFGLDDRVQGRPHHKRGGSIPASQLPRPAMDPWLVLQALDREALRSRASGTGTASTPGIRLWPAQVGRLYDFPTGVDGSGETIAIIALAGGFRRADVAAYFDRAGIDTPSLTAVAVGAGRNRPGGKQLDLEVMLDVAVAGSIAPGAAIAVYFADSDDQGFFNAVSAAIHDAERAPTVLSISWGHPEQAWTDQARSAFVDAFADAAALGVTVLCASGDNGAADLVPDGTAHVDFPGSSPNTVACGGTTLLGAAGGTVEEGVWNDRNGFASGGGFSRHFAVPPWQRGIRVPRSRNDTKQPGRGVPDVAGDADVVSGYIVRLDGAWVRAGGSSAVAPLYAGLCALINQARRSPLGALAPTLYALHAARPAAVFRDVTIGDNSVPAAAPSVPAVEGYRAATGWDACTGLGSINGRELLDAIRASTAQSAVAAG